MLRPLPLAPLSFLAESLLVSLARRHPRLLARLGDSAARTYLIDPTDLPFVFVLKPDPDHPSISAVRSEDGVQANARIAGRFAALLGLVHGAYDGDALFFSRDLVIEGDTEAVLALRNAIDDAELDLAAEAAAALGPLGGIAETAMRIVLPAVEHVTGVALTRAARPQR